MRTLYTGLDANRYRGDFTSLVHYPLIETRVVPYESDDVQQALDLVPAATHMIFTSQTAVRYFFDYVHKRGESVAHLKFFAVGKATALALKKVECAGIYLPEHECAEGLVALMHTQLFSNAYVIYPHSKRSRTVIAEWLACKKIGWFDCPLYETQFLVQPLLDLTQFDRIVFTSPSTVDAFINLYKILPSQIELKAIGPITEAYLSSKVVKISHN